MLKIIDHPIVQHGLLVLRDRETSASEFRRHLKEIAWLLFYEAARELPTSGIPVETPMEKTTATGLHGKVHLIAVLRAALGMVEGIVAHLQNADVGHLGLYRDEQTLQPVQYYAKLPDLKSGEPTFLVDPMLATGGSMVAALKILQTRGADPLSVLTLIAAPEGVAQVQQFAPSVPIFTAALDRQLNTRGYILPGLGDAGDRQFGT